MNSKKSDWSSSVSSYAVLLILALLPFHAVFTTWLGSVFGHLDLFRIWKELLLVPITLSAFWLGWREEPTRKWLKNSRLFRLIAIYIFLNIGLGLVALIKHEVNSTALIYALLVNTRFLVLFSACVLLGVKSEILSNQWRRIVLSSAVIVVAFGLLQHFVLPVDFLRHAGYGSDTIPAVHTVDHKPEYIRLQSTLRGPNPLGAYLVLIITLAAALYVEKGKKKARLVALFTASSVVMFFSYSRSAWLGLLLSLGLILHWSVKTEKYRRILIGGSILLVVIGAGLAVSFRNNDRLQNTLSHTDETSTSLESSNQARTEALVAGVKSVLNQPLGRGPGSAGPASFRNNHPPRIAENYFIQIGQELGLIGMAIFIAINLSVASLLWQRRQDTLSLVLIASLAGITLINMLSHAWTDDTLSLLWWGLAGIALSPVILKETRLKQDG